MELLRPSTEFIVATPKVMQLLERAGRICYQSEEKHEEQYKALLEADEHDLDDELEMELHGAVTAKFIGSILKRGHLSVIEHASATAEFICDRGVTHEMVRHRLAAYSQESTRYVNYGKHGGCKFIIPPWCDVAPGEYSGDIRQSWRLLISARDGSDCTPTDAATRVWMEAMQRAEWAYNELIAKGWSPQKARSVLPNSTKTHIAMTANLREWMHVFTLRTGKAAHPQIREVMMPLLANFRLKWPVLFEKIGIVDEGVEPCSDAVL